jgi:hypothetical protein
MTHRSIWITALMLAAAGCASDAKPKTLSLSDGATYKSPDGRFTVIVPVLLRPGEHETERAGDESTTVVFDDRFGTLLEIQATVVPAPQYQELTGPDEEQALQTVFDREVMQEQVHRYFPDAAVRVQDYPYVPAVGRALFATVQVPGGSTLADPADPSHRLDALRGYMVFPMKGSLYIVTSQELPSSPGRTETLNDGERADRLRGRMSDLVAQMDFLNPKKKPKT